MEELAREGYFDGILDLATHELADELKQGYCSGIGPERLEPVPGRRVLPRLIVPGGLDCAVLEFTSETVPPEYRDRKIFFYDFRSAIRLSHEETICIAHQICQKITKEPKDIKILIPLHGWSEADKEGGPLFDPALEDLFVKTLKENIGTFVQITEVPYHINDEAFARLAADMMVKMIRSTPISTHSAS
jgi:uncharacterized protein (UPF0261 family)